jgi:hypothetical protein
LLMLRCTWWLNSVIYWLIYRWLIRLIDWRLIWSVTRWYVSRAHIGIRWLTHICWRTVLVRSRWESSAVVWSHLGVYWISTKHAVRSVSYHWCLNYAIINLVLSIVLLLYVSCISTFIFFLTKLGLGVFLQSWRINN